VSFTAGDRVLYVLPAGYGRDVERRLPAVVVNVTAMRVVIRLDGSSNHRNTLPISLIKDDAAADVPPAAQ
jgi:hypothetical protein